MTLRDTLQPRRATNDDVPAIQALVTSAYDRYVPLIGRPPGPMLDDYGARVRDDLVFVAELDGALAAVLVLIEKPGIAKPGHLLLDNIAVAPLLHGLGYGSQLVRFAEAEGRRRGFTEIRLYTHELMRENIGLYERLGFTVTHRAQEAGYARVYMAKAL